MSTPNQPPSNPSELQLYRVLQRANLLQYYDTFISQGGDDVHQLCEAGEDEFLEIMALVGMASKPLHVRRLQKALQAWVLNPSAFDGNVRKNYPTHVHSMTGSAPQNTGLPNSQSLPNSAATTSLGYNLSPVQSASATVNAPDKPIIQSAIFRSGQGQLQQDYKVTPPQSSTISTSTPWSYPVSASNLGNDATSRTGSPNAGDRTSSPSDSHEEELKDMMFSSGNGSINQPVLMEYQITAIAAAAALLAQELPPIEPKAMPRKQISKEIQEVMLMTSSDPTKMDAMRKYAAIYGRFDSKRKNDRPMSLHEISVNEAAAQLCNHLPALLTRREELFPLARQVVRDSGYQYSKGHSRAAEIIPTKLEPPNSDPEVEPSLTSSPPSPSSAIAATRSTSPQGDKANQLTSELMDLTCNLSEMAKEQERIRAALRVLLEAKDHTQMSALTRELDVINDRYTRMTTRRQELVKRLAVVKRPVQNTVLMKNTITDKPNNHLMLESVRSSHAFPLIASTSSFDSLDAATTSLQNTAPGSLIEEGLRIATQYGMADFAQEIMGLKSLQSFPNQKELVKSEKDIDETDSVDVKNVLDNKGDNRNNDKNVEENDKSEIRDKQFLSQHIKVENDNRNDSTTAVTINSIKKRKSSSHGKRSRSSSRNSNECSSALSGSQLFTITPSPTRSCSSSSSPTLSSSSKISWSVQSTTKPVSSVTGLPTIPPIKIVSGYGFQQYSSSASTKTHDLRSIKSSHSPSPIDNARSTTSSPNLPKSNQNHPSPSQSPKSSSVSKTLNSMISDSSHSVKVPKSFDINLDDDNNKDNGNDNDSKSKKRKERKVSEEFITLSIPTTVAVDLSKSDSTNNAIDEGKCKEDNSLLYTKHTSNGNNSVKTTDLDRNSNKNTDSANCDSSFPPTVVVSPSLVHSSNTNNEGNMPPLNHSPSKFGDVEGTRRSNRKRNSDSDYSIINGGEKRTRLSSSSSLS